MTQATPWSIKGIRADNREAVKELAGRQGVTIGEMINNLIEEAENRLHESPPSRAHASNRPQFGGAPPLSPFPQTPQYGDANMETRHLANIVDNLSRKLDAVGILGGAVPNQSFAPFAAPQAPSRPDYDFGLKDNNSRIDRLTERAIETLISRVEENEKRSDRGFNQVSQSLNDIKQAQETIADRLRRIENDDPQHRSIAALRSLEAALSRLAGQISENQERTANIERHLEGDVRHRHSPEDVERIISQSTQNMSQSFEGKISLFAQKLEAVEEITAQAVGETDKGINLLADRLRETEERAKQSNETLKDALMELSARLTNIEGTDSKALREEISQGFENRFASLQGKIDEVGASIHSLVHEARVESENKHEALTANLFERVQDAEQATLAAIENIGQKVVETSSGLDERLKAVESLNNNSKDSALAMRLELGRITRAIDDRLSALENRESDFIDNAGKHINQLAEQVSARLGNLEGSSNHIVDRVSQETKQIADGLLSRQEEVNAEFNQKLAQIDERIGKRLEDRLAIITREIHAAEDRAKAATGPLQASFNALLDRVDSIDSGRAGGSVEIMSPPDYDFGASREFKAAAPLAATSPAQTQRAAPFTFDDEQPSGGLVFGDEEIDSYQLGSDFSSERLSPFEAAPQAGPVTSGGFAGPSPKFEQETMPSGFSHDALSSDFGEDFAASANQIPDENGNYDFGLAQNAPNIATSGFDGSEAGGDEEWLSGLPVSGPKENNKDDFLSRARRAALEAANNSAEKTKAKKPQAQKKTGSVKEKAKLPQISVSLPSNSTKANAKPILTPVVMATAGAIVIATAVGGMLLTNRNKVNQNELPATLRQDVANTAPATPPPPQAAAPIVPTNEVTATPPPVVTNEVIAPATMPPPMPAKAVVKTAPTTQPSAPLPKAVTAAPVNGQIITPVGPRNATVPAIAPKATKTSSINPSVPNNGTPRIASAVQTPASNTPAAANLTQARQVYAQALARTQAGDAAGARQLMTRAADLGDTRAQNRLAKMYERGEGVTRDMAQARRWTERAAQAGSRQAQHNLGVYFSEGAGVQQDFNRASENFRRAARRGLPDSQYNLGLLAEQGLGGTKNNREAYYWYALAAKSGDSDAQRKAAELSRNLAPADRVAEDRRVVAFRAETGGPD